MQALSSYVFIAANVILHGKKVTQFGHLDELLPPIVPLLTSHHHTLRGFTQELEFECVPPTLMDRVIDFLNVFRATALAVADKSILNDKQFQLISVTAEKWVPVLEVPVGSMKAFLEKKKQEGFAILGLEQTANSVALDQYNFPTKT
ncbi:UNVERIFIED_CONTAM: putative methyltransferase TARBP1, partial [Sesamum angustifolium]